MALISIIIPCFNEEESLIPFHRETKKVIDHMEGTDYEMIFVDDGSSDRTLELLRGLQQSDRHCRYISFSRNFGK